MNGTMRWTIPLGAGCRARVRLAHDKVHIAVLGPSGKTTRRVEAPWTATAIRQADAEVRHIATAACRAGAPRPA